MLRHALPLLALLAGCAGRIPAPQTAPVPGEAGGDGPEVEVCLLVGEQLERRLYEGTATLSFAKWDQVIGTVLVRHPAGLTAIDPAFGTDIGRDLRRAPLWFRLVMGGARGKRPLAELLAEAGVEPHDVRQVLLTHAHWDHAGGLADLPAARLHVSRDEWDFIGSLGRYLDRGAMRHHFDGVGPRVAAFDWTGPPYGGFPSSHDVFGDGTVVAVPMPGHTPGSTGFFVRGQGGQRWLLVGDTAWTVEGIRRPVHKTPAARAFVDADVKKVGQALGHLHALAAAWPELQIVPAHDFQAMKAIPPCAPPPPPAAATPGD